MVRGRVLVGLSAVLVPWGCTLDTDIGVVSTGFGDSTAASSTDGDATASPLVVSEPGTIVNEYRPLAVDVDVGSTSVIVDGILTGWQPGDQVMVWQTAIVADLVLTADEVIDPEPTGLGTWEWARILEVDGEQLELEAPLARAYSAAGAQVVRVPEWSSVQIVDGASLAPLPWDGRRGGIVIVLAQESVTGSITADGAGLRGGAHAMAGPAIGECAGELEPEPRGAQKGEGVNNAPYIADERGRGFVANGGGGGVCWRAGGGGGGGGGAGGIGGRSSNWDGSRIVAGGLGGRPLLRAADRLMLGGGGGGGHGTGDEPQRDGAPGGGVVFVRAPQFDGQLSAEGASALEATNDGAGGGGAGGGVVLEVTTDAVCSDIDVTGGAGGDVDLTDGASYGPGGGGGGGYAILRGAPGCTARVDGGPHGQMSGARDYGSVDGAAGQIER